MEKRGLKRIGTLIETRKSLDIPTSSINIQSRALLLNDLARILRGANIRIRTGDIHPSLAGTFHSLREHGLQIDALPAPAGQALAQFQAFRHGAEEGEVDVVGFLDAPEDEAFVPAQGGGGHAALAFAVGADLDSFVEGGGDGDGAADAGAADEADDGVVAGGVRGGELGAFEAEGDVDGGVFWGGERGGRIEWLEGGGLAVNQPSEPVRPLHALYALFFASE